MKNLDLNSYGVHEMDAKAIGETNGGNFWGVLGVACVIYEAATGRNLVSDTRSVLIASAKDVCQSTDSNYQLTVLGH